MSMLIAHPAEIEDHRELPASLDDLKEQLRIEHNEQDRLLITKLMAATNEAEEYINGPILLRSLKVELDSFPEDGAIVLPNTHVNAVTSVEYYDADNVLQTVSALTYFMSKSGPYPALYPQVDATWPETAQRAGAIVVTYVAGLVSKPSAVPMAVREAVILRAATRHAMAEESGTGTVAWALPDDLAFKSLLLPFRGMGL